MTDSRTYKGKMFKPLDKLMNWSDLSWFLVSYWLS